ncbi:hypothetical protein FIBSPDRAFT_1035990 [Athelia psychrophila]|uniref:DUF6534 domain-containing protein n=1 Tax=Athelia psychrophila TaxID=1759441 RepID=A0A166W5T2_9AGAM|nr:hypothetical protein FIBSPDRAFT_1035990 [Fibularhizoctonia sp. CBS 109695]
MAKNAAEIGLGPMLIGTMLDILLYGITIAQVHTYFTTFPKDRKWFKCFVLFLLVANTLNVLFDVVYIYQSLVVHFGDVSYFHKANWVFATDPAMTGIIASSVQLFFSWRIKVISGNTLTAAFVGLGSFIGLLGSIGTSIAVGIVPEFTEFVKFEVIVIIWLVSAVLTDVCIAFTLSYHLQRRKTNFATTDDVVNRIIRLTIQTGAIVAVWATIDLIVYLVDNTGIHFIFNFPLSKLYTITLMSSLNSRRGWKFGISEESSSGNAVGTRGTSNAVDILSANGRQEIFVQVERHEMNDVEDRDKKYNETTV